MAGVRVAGESEAEEERRLVAAVARGDRRAFETLYERHAPRVGAYLFKLTRRRELAEEALSDAMLVLWNSAGKFDGRTRLVSWLLGIGHRTGLRVLARERRLPQGEDAETLGLEGREKPDAQAESTDTRRVLEAAIDALPVEQRAVMLLTFREGLTCAEVASIVECPVNTVKTRLFNARKRLRGDASVRSLWPSGEEA